MKKQSPPAKPHHSDSIERHTAVNDLKFIRSVIEKTHRSFDPGSPVMIVWGLILLIGYPATHYLLATPQLYDFIQPMWIILWVIGASVGMFYGITAEKREKQAGVISRTSNQIGLIWYILLLNGTVWSSMALQGKCYFEELVCFGDPAFLWAAIFGIGLSVSGILSSKVWLFGGIAIFIAILAASIIKVHAYVILGIVMGLACIIPAKIARKNYLKTEKENAQA